MVETVTRLLYGESSDVWHDAWDDIGQQEETWHDARDNTERQEETRVTEVIRRSISKWEIHANDHKGPSVFLDYTQDEVRRLVTEVSGMKKVNMVLVCVMVREDPKTGEQIFTDVNARSKKKYYSR